MRVFKRLVQVSSLAGAVLLLSACPDTKLPSPTPKVPEPKAQGSAHLEAPPGPAAAATAGLAPHTAPS